MEFEVGLVENFVCLIKIIQKINYILGVSYQVF